MYFCYLKISFDFFFYTSAAISTVVSIAEILKNNGFAIEKSKILTAWSHTGI